MCESMRAGRQHVADELREAVERKLVADATVIHGPADGVPMFTDTGAHSFPEAGAEMFTDTAPVPDPAGANMFTDTAPVPEPALH